MKTHGGVGVFLTSILVGGEWPASRLGRFTYGERAPNTHWIGGWSYFVFLVIIRNRNDKENDLSKPKFVVTARGSTFWSPRGQPQLLFRLWLNDTMIENWWLFVRQTLFSSSRQYPGICLEWLGQTMKTLSWWRPSPGRNRSPRPSEY
jgi:hypothetical protein